jgi:hypothetical protein
MTRHPGTACGLLSRRSRRLIQAGLSCSWCAAVLLSALLAACGSPPRAAPSRQATGAAAPGVSNVFRGPLQNPQVFATGGATFVAWRTSAPGSAAVRSELARISATGTIQARQRFGASVLQVLTAAGSLWVAAWSGSVPATETLLSLNPATLQVTGQWQMGTGGEPASAAQVLAVARGGLWLAASNRLVRVSLPSGKVTATIALPGANSSDVSANAAGTMLVVGEANNQGLGAVERRDATTGALLASRRRLLGVTDPVVAGPVGSAVWMSEATGMMGYVQRLDAATMTAAGSSCADGKITRTCVFGTNDITARVADGLLWVTQEAGGNARNYCAEPASGRRLAPIELPRPNVDLILAIGPHQVFYAAPGPKASSYLRREPIPRACHARS